MLNSRLRKFFSYYKPYRRLLIADVLCAVLVAAIALALPLFARHITGVILPSNAPDTVAQIVTTGAVMLALVLLQTACNIFVDYQGHTLGAMIEADMRGELFDHYQKLSFSFYDEQKTGQLMSRLTHDLFAVSELYHHGPEEGIIALLKFVGAFFILLTINVGITLLIFLFLPLMALLALYWHRRIVAAWAISYARIGDINAQVEEALAGVRVVKAFANEPLEREKFARENRRFVDSKRAAYRFESYFSGGFLAFEGMMTLALIVIGGIVILNGGLNLADLVTYLLYVAVLMDPIQKFVNLARLYQEGITGYNRFMDMMHIAPDMTDAPNALELTTVHGRIQFENVQFRYREEGADILNGVSLDIAAGEYIALVGTSGVGKTTLCSLIPRFYEVTSGAILLDGRDIREVTLRSLRQHIGMVQQEVYLFAGSIAENIGYGKPSAGRDAIIAAAKRANAHDFIMALPQGYDTDIGQRGVKLSGGQKQRLSIARAFLKDPPILIFDEATSALDNESERAVQESLEALARNRTTLVIAHRLTTIRNAHRIIVLTDEGIAEDGTHEQLLAAGGVYAGLYEVG
jgi:ATP-binding cassette subfamily B protein